MSILVSEHSFICRRNRVDRLYMYMIEEKTDSGSTYETRMREREPRRNISTVVEQWASRETTTISHLDPLVSLL